MTTEETLKTLMTNCKTLQLAPAQFEVITKGKFASPEDKLYASWSAYFGHMWRTIGEAFGASLVERLKVLKPLAYQADIHAYIRKHARLDAAYVSYLEHMFSIKGVSCVGDNYFVLFSKRVDLRVEVESVSAASVPMNVVDLEDFIWRQSFIMMLEQFSRLHYA